MRLNTRLDSFQILAQPVVAKLNTHILLALSLGFDDQRLEGLEFVEESSESFPLGISICPNMRHNEKRKI
jgi:hypothetical protein